VQTHTCTCTCVFVCTRTRMQVSTQTHCAYASPHMHVHTCIRGCAYMLMLIFNAHSPYTCARTCVWRASAAHFCMPGLQSACCRTSLLHRNTQPPPSFMMACTGCLAPISTQRELRFSCRGRFRCVWSLSPILVSFHGAFMCLGQVHCFGVYLGITRFL